MNFKNSNPNNDRCFTKRSKDKASRYNTVYNTFNSITMCDVLERSNMLRALERVKTNKGCAGIDGMDIYSLPEYLKTAWPEIKESILDGSYKPQPVKTVHIPKPNGDKRMLGIPTMLDRLIQQAINQKLSTIYDKTFSDNSYGFRAGRNAHQAIIRAKEYQEAGYTTVIDIDLKKFFDEVNHDRLMAKLAQKITDRKLLQLIRRYLQSGMMQEGTHYSREKGTPQGSPLSPLLSNIVLDELDKELENRGHKFCRYADDCNIYVKTQRSGERVYKSISKFIESKLRLKVNQGKSAVAPAWRRNFLGYSYLGQKKVRIRCSLESVKRFKGNIRNLTRGHDRRSLEDRISVLNQYIRGWFGYFKLVETTNKLKGIDGWIRCRLRMCALKLWWRARTRVKMMLKLGMPLEEARGFSQNKRYWHLSHVKSSLFYMNKEFWESKGYHGLEWNMKRIVN